MNIVLTDITHVGDLHVGTADGTSETISTCPGSWRVQFCWDHHRICEIGLYRDDYVGDVEAREHRLPDPLYIDSRWLTLTQRDHWFPEQEEWVNERFREFWESADTWSFYANREGITVHLSEPGIWNVFVQYGEMGQARSIRLAVRD